MVSEKETLTEELRVQKESVEDLNCSLQQTRADFIKYDDYQNCLLVLSIIILKDIKMKT